MIEIHDRIFTNLIILADRSVTQYDVT